MQGPSKKPLTTFAVMDLDNLAGKKGGRVTGSTAYSTTDVALLSLMTDTPDSFNASESSLQWEAVFKGMKFFLKKWGSVMFFSTTSCLFD